MLDYKEEENAQNPLYTEADTVPAIDTTVGNYSLLKSIATVATGASDVPDEVSFDSFVDKHWRTTVPESNQLDQDAAINAATNGNVSVVQEALTSLAARNDEYGKISSQNATSVRSKLKELTAHAVENTVSNNPAILINNTPQEISSVTEGVTKRLAAATTIEQATVDGSKWSNIIPGLLYEFTPPAAEQGPAIDRVAIKYGAPADMISRTTGRSETTQWLRTTYDTIPDDKKDEWLTGLYKDLQDDWLITDWQAAITIKEITSDSASEWDGVFDWFDRLGAAATLATGVGAILKAGKGFKTASNLSTLARTIAVNGGKDAIVTAEAVKIASKAANAQRLQALGVVAGEATGMNVAIDLAKLVGLNVSKILPETIMTASNDLQKVIRDPVEKLIAELQNVVATKGIRSEEAAQTLMEIERTYSKASNPNIHSVDAFKLAEDGTSIDTKVLYKPANATSFLTEQSAVNYIKSLDPVLAKNMKVVPDTTNTAFLVEDSVKVDLKTRKTQLEALVIEEIANAAKAEKRREAGAKRKAAGVATSVPKGLVAVEHGTPAGKLVFASAVDKAIYTKYSKAATLVDAKTLQDTEKYITDNTGWKASNEKSHFLDLEEHIKSLTAGSDGNISVTSITPSRDSGFQPQPSLGLSRMGYLDNIDGSTTVGNLTMGSSVPKADVTTFISKLNAALGMEDRKIVVMGLEDLRVAGKGGNIEMQNLYNVSLTHSKAGALHYNFARNVSVIVMMDKSSMIKTRVGYMETLAHEYGHAFEAQFHTRHFHTINRAFNKFLKAKGMQYVGEGINKQIPDMFSLEAILEYRSLKSAESLATWIDKYANGDLKAYKASEKEMHQWLTSYSEFFSENFAKWAFTDKVATDITGQMFASLVRAFKRIAAEVNSLLSAAGLAPITGKADKTIARMLNTHVKMIQADVGDVKASMQLIANESKKVTKPSLEKLQKELEEVGKELAAIDDAEKGLKTGWLVEKPVSTKLDYSLIGKYSDEDINSASRFSLGDWALSTSKELYSERVVGINQQSRYIKLLTNYIRPSLEKLNGAERVALDNVLVLGDKEAKVFSEAELAGSELSAAAREAYYKVRALRDVMYQMRNDVAVKSLIRKGYEQLRTGIKFDSGDGSFFGKQITPAEGKFVYLADDNVVQRVSPAFLEEAKARGLVFYESNEPQLIGGKGRKLFAFTEGGVDTSKIESVIPYRTGEYRRIYSDDYFVKIISKGMVDNEIQTFTSTHRTAASAGEANRYVQAFNEAVSLHRVGKLDFIKASDLMQAYGWEAGDFIKSLDEGKFGDDFKLEVRYNRTDDDYLNETIGIGSTPSNSRGDKVLSVHGEDTVNTLSPLDSVASEISNTAYVASSTEWRESHIRRWFNTFQDLLPADVAAMDAEQAFRFMLNNKGRYFGQDKRMAVAQKVQDYIVSQMNIPSKEERATIGTMRLLSESVEGKLGGGKAISKVGVGLRATKDYAVWARTLAFHSFFAFNPVQFFMQGMNAFNAIAVSPIHGLRSVKSATMYSMALMSDQPEIWTKFAQANKLSNLGLGMEVEEFVEVVSAIRRTGLLDGLNTTSLYGAETGKYGLFNGLTRKAGAVSAAPFNAGEGYSRLVSFDIARREFMEANKGVAWWTDDSIAKIISRQDDLTQNMTTANTSFWQKGLLSIPAQFTQYQVKLMMNVVQSLLGNSRAFTRKEAVQLLITHGVVMGTAGNFMWPFRESIESSLPDNMSETQRLTIQQGILSGVIASLTDGEVKLALGSRFNTFRYYEDILTGLLDPEKNFLEIMTGPSGFAGFRILGGVGEALSIVVKAPMTPATMQIALAEIGRTAFSSINNVQKMRIAQANYNQVMSGSGAAMFQVTDAETYFLGLGIPSVQQEDLSIMFESRKAHKNDLDSAAKAIGKHAMLAITALNNKDTESHATHAAVVQAILNTYSGTDLQQLMSAAYKVEAFTMYKKMVVDRMVKEWSTNDLTVDTGVNK